MKSEDVGKYCHQKRSVVVLYISVLVLFSVKFCHYFFYHNSKTAQVHPNMQYFCSISASFISQTSHKLHTHYCVTGRGGPVTNPASDLGLVPLWRDKITRWSQANICQAPFIIQGNQGTTQSLFCTLPQQNQVFEVKILRQNTFFHVQMQVFHSREQN